MNPIRRSTFFATFGFLGGHTTMKVAPLDPRTGRLPSREQARVVTRVSYDLDRFTTLLLMPDNDFVRDQVGQLRFFDETMTIEDLERAVIEQGLADRVPSLQSADGIQRACQEYKPFLWLHFKTRHENNRVFGQFALINPEDRRELFLAERPLDYQHAGVNDQNTWYPMFNALIDYIDENSGTWAPNGPLALAV